MRKPHDLYLPSRVKSFYSESSATSIAYLHGRGRYGQVNVVESGDYIQRLSRALAR
jgi:hypothetical protein